MNEFALRPIFIRLSGGVRVEVDGSSRTDFGTAKNRSLLALLALRRGGLTSRETAIELLWPDADIEAGRNRLSTALVQLRKVLLLDDSTGKTALQSDRTHLWLEADLCEVDALLFQDCDLEGTDPSEMALLERTFNLYGGPLAPEIDDDWILGEQARFSELVDLLARHIVENLLAAGRTEDARGVLYRFRKLSDAQEPDGWQDHVGMPNRCEPLHAELEAAFGSLPRVQMDFGALSPESRYYVRRAADDRFSEALAAGESIVLIKGPRQIGKTSMLARGVGQVKRQSARCAFTDFQKFPQSLLGDESAFYVAIAETMALQIDFEYDFERNWRPSYGVGMNLEYFVRAAVEQSPSHLFWFIDEGDKLFGSAFASDFYGLIRSWHNARAIDPEGPWSRFSITIAYATEAHLFIRDLNQSPFNVGLRLILDDFSRAQIESLNVSLGEPIGSKTELEELVSLVGGHPFLIRRALHQVQEGKDLQAFLTVATSPDGPFGDHLNRVFTSITRSQSVRSAVESVLRGSSISDAEALYRLMAAGVVRLNDRRVPIVRNRLYHAFLTEALTGTGLEAAANHG